MDRFKDFLARKDIVFTLQRYGIDALDWVGLVLICFILPAILSTLFCRILRNAGWIKDGDLKLEL